MRTGIRCEQAPDRANLYSVLTNLTVNKMNPKQSLEECINLSGSKQSNHTASNSSIFVNWCFFLRISQLFGGSLLTPGPKEVFIGDNCTDKRKILQFRLFSWTTFYVVSCHLFRIGLCCLYYRDWGYNLLGREYNNTMEDWIVRSMNISLPGYQIWDMCCVWLTFRKAEKLCNTWLYFEIKFKEVFNNHYDYRCHLKKSRYLIFASTIVPVGTLAGIFITDVVSAIEHKSGRLAGFTNNNPWDWVLTGFGVLSVVLFVVTTILEETKVLLTYRTLREAYKNIRNGIASQVGAGKILTEDEVSQWTKLIGIVRRQGKLTGELQTPLQIVIFIHTVVIFTESFFLFIKTTMTKQRSNYIWACTVISFMFAVRLVVKIMLADKITREEQQLGDEIMEIDPSNMDVSAKFEAKKVGDMILNRPMKVSFSEYIILQKQIIPKILSYVVAYLVVLFQFQLSNGFNEKNDNCTSIN